MKKIFLLAVALLYCATWMLADGQQPVTFETISNPVKDGSLPSNMSKGTMIFGDYNNDGLIDIFYAGGDSDDNGNRHVGFFKNLGNNQWQRIDKPYSMKDVCQGAAVWIDYNNDGNLDIIYVGKDENKSRQMYAYKNKGAAGNYEFEKDDACSFTNCSMEDNATQGLTVLDYNNDGWMDLAVVGSTGSDQGCTYVYENQHGYFSNSNKISSFSQRYKGNIYAFDYNGDGFMDLGYNGQNGSTYSNKVYTNNGNGSFGEFTGIPFVPSQKGALFTIDANNDGYQDFIQICRNTDNGWKDYGAISTYNGSSYSTNATCGLTGGDGVASVGDVNNDGYMDIYYAGYPNQKLAYGKGDGTFTEEDFSGDMADFATRGGMVNLVDLNGDNLLDIAVCGYNDGKNGYRNVMALNTTDGLTNAAPTAPTNLQIQSTTTGFILTWDAGTDDHTPVGALRYNIVATNSKGKVFAINPADLATGKQKVAGGYTPYLNARRYEFKTKQFSKFYVQAIDGANVGSEFVSIESGEPEPKEFAPATFTKLSSPVSGGSLPSNMENGTMIFGDYNNDGLMDIFYVGGIGKDNKHIGLLKNTSSGSNCQWQRIDKPEGWPQLCEAAAVWIDYNNDGNLDIIYAGNDGSNRYMEALKNTGNGTDNPFTKEENTVCRFIGAAMEKGSMQGLTVLDYNNDGWMDVAVVGSSNQFDDEWSYTYLYINQKGVGNKYFDTEHVIKNIQQSRMGNIYAFDYNSDGIMDLGYNGQKRKHKDNDKHGSQVYTNNGTTFTSFTGIPFGSSRTGALFTIDANNDGYQDFIQICRNPDDWSYSASVYTFDGASYTQKANCGLTGGDGVASVGDVNNDGNMDMYISGYPTRAIAYGKGDATFMEYNFSDGDFNTTQQGMVNMVDVNGDNLLDIHVCGSSDGGQKNAIALNTTDGLTNAAPATPDNLTLTATDNGYRLAWTMPANADDVTPNAALRYNVMATNAEGKLFAINPADLVTGKQKVAGGYTPYLNTCFYEFKTTEFTKFYVQAIDGANVGSAFASIAVPLVLDEATDNSTAINDADGKLYEVEVGRAFENTNLYYTLCLPFDLDNASMTSVFGENTELWYLASSEKNADGDIYLNFEQETTLEAGKPYLFKPGQPVAKGWKVEAIINNEDTPIEQTNATMHGIYSPMDAGTLSSLTAQSAYFLAPDDYLYLLDGNTVTAGFRAYFTLPGLKEGAKACVRRLPTIVTPVNEIADDTVVKPRKLLRNGQLYILRNGHGYNVQGRKIY